MKFWQRAFLAILAVVVISMNGCLYLTAQYSFSLNVQQETHRALGEYQVIATGIDQTLVGLEARRSAIPTAAVVSSAVSALADYYARQGIYFSLQQSHRVLFSNVPYAAWPSPQGGNATPAHTVLTIGRQGTVHYLNIVGPLRGPQGHYTFTYVTSLAVVYNSQALLTRHLVLVSAGTEVLLALALLVILRRLTRPIRLMQEATDKVSKGVYDERIHIGGSDEFHDLAENFNRMAQTIQGRIAALDSSIQEKQRLMDNLAHELRTPMTAIRGYAQYLQSSHSDERQRIKAAGHILGATDRTQDLIHKLLDVALLRNHKIALGKVRPQDLLRQVEALTASKLQARGITLAIRCALDDPLVGDATLLQSLLINLIDNAAQASPAHAVITLAAYREHSPVLEVRDSGSGMAEDQLSRVWEPFYRVDPARSRSAGGVGLGLSMCREIARVHQADLEIQSQLGRGTTVRMIFYDSVTTA